jgi:hypothetical protein
MEPAGSGATWTGSPKGVFAERKYHKPRQGAAASTPSLYRDGAVGFIDWLDDLGLLSRIVLLKNLHLVECDDVMNFPSVICAAARMRLLGRRPLRDEDDF